MVRTHEVAVGEAEGEGEGVLTLFKVRREVERVGEQRRAEVVTVYDRAADGKSSAELKGRRVAVLMVEFSRCRHLSGKEGIAVADDIGKVDAPVSCAEPVAAGGAPGLDLAGGSAFAPSGSGIGGGKGCAVGGEEAAVGSYREIAVEVHRLDLGIECKAVAESLVSAAVKDVVNVLALEIVKGELYLVVALADKLRKVDHPEAAVESPAVGEVSLFAVDLYRTVLKRLCNGIKRAGDILDSEREFKRQNAGKPLAEQVVADPFYRALLGVLSAVLAYHGAVEGEHILRKGVESELFRQECRLFHGGDHLVHLTVILLKQI